jgi:hypothetical protein
MNQTDTEKKECRECKHVFLLAFAVLLAFFLYTYFTRSTDLLLTNVATTTGATSTPIGTTTPQLLNQ